MLERDAELSALAHAVREAADRHGSVVLVKGEAGIGKSCLVEALRSHLPAEGRMLVGYCDDLATPRTLGPFRDLVGSVGTELSRAVTDGSERDRVLTALRTELTWPEHPTVLVIEDVLVTTFDSLHDMGDPLGRAGLLLVLHLPVRPERAVPGRRLLSRGSGRRGVDQAARRRRRLHEIPPGGRDTFQHHLRGPPVDGGRARRSAVAVKD